MSMSDDDDVGRDLSQLLVLANIFPRVAAAPGTGGDFKILWGRGSDPRGTNPKGENWTSPYGWTWVINIVVKEKGGKTSVV